MCVYVCESESWCQRDREREREREKERKCVCVLVSVGVCVSERERERKCVCVHVVIFKHKPHYTKTRINHHLNRPLWGYDFIKKRHCRRPSFFRTTKRRSTRRNIGPGHSVKKLFMSVIYDVIN